ncbi:MAG: LamG domain-containing protein [Thaumarchaeota archaeon]|nr:LamG domain-containing protein [Nitrososphaerota archaeon]
MKQRRALTTIVGGVFFLIVIITAASYLTYTMNLFENFSENVFAVAQERENRKKESFDISKLTIENNKINLDIYNSGDIPVTFARLWVENVTGVDQVYKFDLNNTVTTGNTIEDILKDVPFIALETQSYKLKLVTDRGTTKEFSVNASTEPLHLQLFALPEEVPTNFISTILLSVTNNSTQSTIYTNIQPVLNVISFGALAEFEGTTPEPHAVLEKGNTVIFEWTYRISGDDGDKVRFEASILNGVPGNTVTKNVEVQKIETAEQSTTSLSSGILTSGLISQNVLLFHKETIDAIGERQMWASSPENDSGEIIDFSLTNAVFYTNTDSNVTINIPAGSWNATLRYISSPMPESLMHTGSNSETMSYHFESDLDSPLDSTGNTIMTLGTSPNRPQWNGTAHHGAGAYEFSGNQFASILTNNYNDLDDSPASTSGWFYAYSSGPASNQMIYFGDTNNGQKSYQIFLNQNGHLVFQLDTGSTIATCTSTVNYKDDSWHHFVAIMPGDNDCDLYVDGLLRDSDTNGGNSAIALQGSIFIGASDASGTDGFNGLIDDIIHWDDYGLIESAEQEVTDLFNTNYGTSSHLLDFDLRIVDEFGTDLGLSNKTISQTLSFPIPYASDFGEYSAPVADIWGQFNFTAITTEERVVGLGERLMINMTYVPKSVGNLNMKMIIDDVSVVSGLGSSFLQTPNPDRAFSGYATYDNSAKGEISIFNPSPRDNWIKYQSRVVFEDELTGTPYASFIIGSGSASLGPNQDSPVIPSGTTGTFEFEKPRSQPGNTSSDLIPEGRYRMYVFLDGYDSAGQIFLQTSLVGIVRVI